ncbi:PaaI family thioesterase [Nocardioides sp. HDW12B]|nr:PaaI family thioesterase [Nocardioides sp. HDW12B]
MTLLGASLVEVAPGHVEIEVVPRPELSQQQSFLHAGVTTTILDSACGYAGLTLMPAGSEVLTVELKVNLLAPAAGDRVVARGRVVRSGRTLTVAQGDAYAVTGGDEVHCATITATLIRVDAPG